MNHRQIAPATSDERGSISDLFYKEAIEHVAVVNSVAAGVIRGNHFHKETTQHVYITRGSFRYWYQPADQSTPPQSVIVRANEMISSPPHEIHAMEMLEPTQFIVFSTGLRGGIDYEKDTFRVPSIVKGP